MRRWLAAPVAAGLLAAAALGIGVAELGREQHAAVDRVQHTLNVLGVAYALDADLQKTVADGRACIISFTRTRQVLFDADLPRIDADLADLRRLVAETPVELAMLDALEPLVAERVADLRASIAMAAEGRVAELQQRTLLRPGEQLMNRILPITDALKAEERRLLELHQDEANRASWRIMAGFLACGVAGAAAAILAAGVLLLRARDQRHAAALARLNAELEARVAARTADLAASEARQRSYFNYAPFGKLVIRRGADGVFVYDDLNAEARRILGWAEDPSGRPAGFAWPGPVAAEVQRRVQACADSGRQQHYTAMRAVHGRPRTFDFMLAPIGEEGRPTDLVLASLIDVTERIGMEEALRQSQKMEAVGRLVAGVAHDFNNILQGIVTGLEMVLDDVKPDTPAGEFAAVAHNAALRGASLTHQLLAYGRKQILRPQPIALAAFLADFRTLLTRTIGPRIAIVLEVEGAPIVLADPGQLQTALLNLAINAADAMPAGGTLRLAARTADPAWVTLTVTDTGTGMDAATLAQAVDPFFTTKGTDGTGLGLSMVQGFAEQSGGRIRIASTPGEGTSVDLVLPAAAETGQEAAAAATAPMPVTEDMPP